MPGVISIVELVLGFINEVNVEEFLSRNIEYKLEMNLLNKLINVNETYPAERPIIEILFIVSAAKNGNFIENYKKEEFILKTYLILLL